jgi:hypothetical protein
MRLVPAQRPVEPGEPVFADPRYVDARRPRMVACGAGPTSRPPTLHRARGRGPVTTARKTDPIRKIPTKNGETRYRFIIDMGKR